MTLLPKVLYSEFGAPLLPINSAMFHHDQARAITPTVASQPSFFEARGSSYNLEEIGSALSFNVLVDRVHAINGHMAAIGFRLTILDDDFHRISRHSVHMNHDTWRTDNKSDNFIHVKKTRDSGLVDTIKHGYLLKSHLTLQGIESLKSVGDSETPPPLQQGSEPLDPYRGELGPL